MRYQTNDQDYIMLDGQVPAFNPAGAILLPSGKRVLYYRGTESVVEDVEVFLARLKDGLKFQLQNLHWMRTILDRTK